MHPDRFSMRKSAGGEAPPEPGLSAWPRPATSPLTKSLSDWFHAAYQERRICVSRIFCLTMPTAAHVGFDWKRGDVAGQARREASAW
jgi:hypothetical protein